MQGVLVRGVLEGNDMSDGGHDVEFPVGSFDLPTELERFRTLRDSVVPEDVVTRMDRATAELVASALADQVPAVGEAAPSFRLPNATGAEVSLDRLLADGPVVVSFYRGAWCPFCNLELRALQQTLPQMRELGAALVAISLQTPDNSLTMVERHGLDFEVLSDVGGEVTRSYGLEFRLPEYLQESYELLGHPLPRFNGIDQHTLPVPATFVVDRDSIIRFAYVNPDYMYRADPADILAALRSIA
ncbi:peroxiredoxin-like family protein [Pseudonocardia xinjiangensis]